MNRDLGVWTSEDCALVLIDYQPEMFEAIRSETDAELVELNVRFLAKTAKAFDIPIVLSTVAVEYGANSPTQPAIAAELPDVEPIDRLSMNAFEDQAFREAVEATGRKRLIMGGLTTEVCLAFAAVDALKDGYDVQFVTDAAVVDPGRPPRGDGEVVARRRRAEHRGRGGLRALPRLVFAARRTGARGHQLVLHRSPEADSRSRYRRGGEAPRASPGGTVDVTPA